ncbi:MAG: preprotein translocase subunit SecA [Planctomycetota bacterium]
MKQSPYIHRIRARVRQLKDLPDQRLKELGLDLKYRAMTGVPIRRLINEGFALVVESSRRHLEMVPYDVQLACGVELALGRIAEMKTGEGKTLTASLVAYLLALFGRGMHVITFNDYLAKRDCETLRPIFASLGLTTGVLQEKVPPNQRKEIYRRDITYGSAKEFGFDFLRDRLAIAQTNNPQAGIMRGTHYALVDEADSIMIDEARTPLIIGMVNQSEQTIAHGCCRWAAEHAPAFSEDQDYTYDHVQQTVKLTAAGMRKLRNLPESEFTPRVSIQQLYANMKNAIKVYRDFHLDKNYAIIDGEIVIIDEFTGRPAEGRQWQQGIHQAVQAKEKLEITPVTRQAATITIQSYFNRYQHLCGMTGTAYTSRREFKKVYKKKVIRIPTHRPIDRTQHPTLVFQTAQEKFAAIADEVVECVKAKRAVLIGNRSVGASELLSRFLDERGVPHAVLNAKYLEKEAEIVEQAGQPGRVTVATNMAGRGTDIKLHSQVRESGGLHVILTELHESQRIDWQLIGRGSRQGDPGTYRICLSLEDEILQLGYGPAKAEKIRAKFRKSKTLSPRVLLKYFLAAQRKTERRFLVDRLIVLKQDVERQKAHFDTGQDPYLNVVMS